MHWEPFEMFDTYLIIDPNKKSQMKSTNDGVTKGFNLNTNIFYVNCDGDHYSFNVREWGESEDNWFDHYPGAE